jgi:hypothetical protein
MSGPSSYFAYDALQPGELAYHHIEDLVTTRQKAWLGDHSLRMRDGLPLLVREHGGRVEGYLLDFRDPVEGLAAVDSYRSMSLYQRLPTGVEVQTDTGTRHASAFLGKSPDKGAEMDERPSRWSSARDTVFAHGVPAAARIARPWLKAVSHDRTWEAHFHLQAAYLLTFTAVERLATFVFGFNDGPTSRVSELSSLPEWSELFRAANVRTDGRRIYSSDDLDREVLGPDGERAWDFWYAIRSNLSHRGKGAGRDLDIVRRAFIDVHDMLRLTLQRHVPAVTDAWRKADPDGEQHSWLLRAQMDAS